MKRLSANIIAIIFLLLSSASLVAAQAPVGYVLDIQGDWYLLRSRPTMLKRWQKLPPAGRIRSSAPTPDAYIVIASLSGGEIIARRKCENEDCSQAFELPSRNRRDSVLQVAVETVTEFLRKSPFIYSIHRSRSFGPGLVEGVVRLDKGRIDLSPVLRQWGHYYVRWRLRPHSVSVGKWSERIVLRTQLGQPAFVTITDFKPGVYEVNLQRPTGSSYETFATAWVLVTTGEKYEAAAVEFQQAVDLTKQWENMIDPLVSQQFLRAHLHYLVEQAMKKK